MNECSIFYINIHFVNVNNNWFDVYLLIERCQLDKWCAAHQFFELYFVILPLEMFESLWLFWSFEFRATVLMMLTLFYLLTHILFSLAVKWSGFVACCNIDYHGWDTHYIYVLRYLFIVYICLFIWILFFDLQSKLCYVKRMHHNINHYMVNEDDINKMQ